MLGNILTAIAHASTSSNKSSFQSYDCYSYISVSTNDTCYVPQNTWNKFILNIEKIDLYMKFKSLINSP